MFVLVSGSTSVNVTTTKLFIRRRCNLCFRAGKQLEYVQPFWINKGARRRSRKRERNVWIDDLRKQEHASHHYFILALSLQGGDNDQGNHHHVPWRLCQPGQWMCAQNLLRGRVWEHKNIRVYVNNCFVYSTDTILLYVVSGFFFFASFLKIRLGWNGRFVKMETGNWKCCLKAVSGFSLDN